MVIKPFVSKTLFCGYQNFLEWSVTPNDSLRVKALYSLFTLDVFKLFYFEKKNNNNNNYKHYDPYTLYHVLYPPWGGMRLLVSLVPMLEKYPEHCARITLTPNHSVFIIVVKTYTLFSLNTIFLILNDDCAKQVAQLRKSTFFMVLFHSCISTRLISKRPRVLCPRCFRYFQKTGSPSHEF